MTTTTENNYTTTNSTTVLFPFTFPYIEESDIKVSLNTVDTTSFTFSTPTTIELNTAPATGVVVRVYRVTDSEDLTSTFFAGSAIRAKDLNDNFTQNLYVTQEVKNDSADALSNSRESNGAGGWKTAISKASDAVTTANAAVVTADAADVIADAAVVTANAANATAGTASTNAAAAVASAATANTTAGNAETKADTAIASATSANTTAASAVTTADAAETKADTAITTANSSNTTAGNAETKADTAISTANTASTNASAAVTTANTASSTATAAQTAVANSVLYTPVANVAGIPGSPSDGDYIEVQNSTGIESFTPLSGLPTGFTGHSQLTVNLLYNGSSATPASTWVWQQYYATDPETRYRKKLIVENLHTIDENYTIGTNNNASSVGPVAVAANKTVTIPANSLYLIH